MGHLLQLVLRRRKLAAGVVASLLLAGVGAFGGHLWYEGAYFITTENASIAGALVQVSSPNSGRMFQLRREVGDVVTKNDPLAIVDMPISATIPSGGSRSSFLDAQDRLVDVPSPVEGVVVSRSVNVGDTVAANQTLFTVVDTRNLWAVANIEETRIAEIRPGQMVEVYVDALHRTLDGVVEGIVPATISTFSLLPNQNAAGNFTKVVQLVPVRIALRDLSAPLIVGASLRVRIHIG